MLVEKLHTMGRPGYDNYFHKPDGSIHRKLTRLSFKNLLHPFQPFAQGQVYFPLRMALEKIKLVVYGDSQAERGSGGNLHSFNNKFLSQALYTYKEDKDLYYAGYSLKELEKFNIYKRFKSLFSKRERFSGTRY